MKNISLDVVDSVWNRRPHIDISHLKYVRHRSVELSSFSIKSCIRLKQVVSI